MISNSDDNTFTKINRVFRLSSATMIRSFIFIRTREWTISLCTTIQSRFLLLQMYPDKTYKERKTMPILPSLTTLVRCAVDDLAPKKGRLAGRQP
jgi:hypothetical protein